MIKSPLFLVLTLIFSISAIYAQNSDLPHVTQINVETRNNLIRLTWVDSPQARGPVYIFRSARPFSGSIPANIRPVVVRYGTQYYIDDTDDLGNLYYFIAASDTSGRRYDIFIPQTNSAYVNLAQPQQDEHAPALPAISLPVPPEPIEGISNLKAVMEGEKVIITYDNTNPQRNVILFRSNRPVRRPADLIYANIVKTDIEGRIDDYPVPGITWYYALIYEDEISSGYVEISPGNNATVSAVIISSDQTAGRSMRPIPLPTLALRDIPGGFMPHHNRQIPLGAQSVEMLKIIQCRPKRRWN